MSPTELLILAGLAAVVTVAWIVNRSRGATSAKTAAGAQPTCAACGYSVVGLESLQCPECGGDLRLVGIRPPGAAPPLDPRFAPVFMILALGGCAGLLFMYAALEMLPKAATLERTTVFRRPRSGGYLGADVTIDAQAWAGRAPSIRSRVTLQRAVPATAGSAPAAAPGIGPLEVDVLTGAYAYDAPDGRRVSAAGGFGGDAVLGWMKDGGFDVTDPSLREEAAGIAVEARRGGLLRLQAGWPWNAARRSTRTAGPEMGFGNVSYEEATAVSATLPLALAAAAVTIGPAVAAIVFLIRRTRPEAAAPPPRP